LAIELADAARERFGDGCFFVDLSSLDSGAAVIEELAESLGVEEPERGSTLSQAVCRRLAQRRALVVLDGCEHVVDDAARMTADLLAASPQLTVVATSRQPLLLDGELTWTVPTMNEADGRALFLERTYSARPDRPLRPGDESAVLEVCRRLDGLPLAIELAAARTRALSPGQIAASLGRRFELLAVGSRTASVRHATLRASMDWSHDLLDEPERRLFRRLGVFVGGFDLEAVTAVFPDANVDQLGALVDRSLVVAEDHSDETSYRLLETTRAYALEQLVIANEEVESRCRHRDHYLALAEAAEPMLTRSGQDDWLPRLASERGNLLAALAWSRDQPRHDLLARQAVAMTPYWLERSQWTECGLWLEAASSAPGLPPVLRAQVLDCLCYLQSWLGNLSVVPSLAGEALTLARSASDRRQEGRALGYLAVSTALAMGADPARPYFEDAAWLARSTNDGWGVSGLLTFFSFSRIFQADPDEPRQLLEEALATAGERGDRRWLRLASVIAALAATTQGRLDEASAHVDRGLPAARAAEHAFAVILGLAADAWIRLLRGNFEGALEAAAESIRVANESDENAALEGLATCIFGWALRSRGELGEALERLGEAADLVRSSELPRWVGLPLVHLAEARLEAGDADGAVVSLDEATAVASAAGYTWIAGRAERVRSRLLAASGDHERAESHIHEALILHKSAGDRVGGCDSLEQLAAICSARGHPDVALRLWGSAHALRADLGHAYLGAVNAEGRNALTAARRAVGVSADALWEEGSHLDLDQAVAYASRSRGKRSRPSSGWPSLTPTELEVVRLVGHHLTNPEISERLFISRATVKTHLVHIFTKLNVRSRSELAAEARQHDLA
jgi:predicted ATPase/DNA-binding CsgD family transcriptional regulator